MVTRKTALVLAMNKRKFRGPKAEHDEGTIKKKLDTQAVSRWIASTLLAFLWFLSLSSPCQVEVESYLAKRRGRLPVPNSLKQSPPFCAKKNNNHPPAIIRGNTVTCMVSTKGANSSLKLVSFAIIKLGSLYFLFVIKLVVNRLFNSLAVIHWINEFYKNEKKQVD